MRTLIAWALLATGCNLPYFAIEVDVQEICAVGLDAEMPGVPAPPLQHVLGDDFSELTLMDDLETDIRVMTLAIDVHEADLDMLEGLHVFVAAEGLPMAEVAGSDRVVAVDHVVTVEAQEPLDISEYMLASNMQMALNLSGPLPSQTWNAKVDVCFSAAARYRETL